MNITREGLTVCAIALAIIVLFGFVAHACKVIERQAKNDAIACGIAGNQWREVSDGQFACLTNQGN